MPMIRALIADARGVALIEFGLMLPVLLVAVLVGSDYAYYVMVRQQVASVARMTADNASRIGEESTDPIKKVSEAAILDTLGGGLDQASNLDMTGKGRIILSSLEQNADGGQWLHWQRCVGGLAYDSSQGHQGDGASGTGFPGMGRTELKARPDSSIMFVEVAYAFKPLFGWLWNAGNDRIVEMAAFRTREPRDLTQVYNAEAVPAAVCGAV